CSRDRSPAGAGDRHCRAEPVSPSATAHSQTQAHEHEAWSDPRRASRRNAAVKGVRRRRFLGDSVTYEPRSPLVAGGGGGGGGGGAGHVAVTSITVPSGQVCVAGGGGGGGGGAAAGGGGGGAALPPNLYRAPSRNRRFSCCSKMSSW